MAKFKVFISFNGIDKINGPKVFFSFNCHCEFCLQYQEYNLIGTETMNSENPLSNITPRIQVKYSRQREKELVSFPFLQKDPLLIPLVRCL